MLFVVTTIRAIGSGIQSPAVNAFLPSLVTEDKLTKVNGVNGSIQAFVMLVSPMLSGALLSVATIESIFFIDVVTALLAVIILLVFLREPEHTVNIGNQPVSYFHDLRKGINYINRNSYLKYFFLFCGCFFILAMPFFNTPPTVLLQEKVEEAYLGRVFGVFGMMSASCETERSERTKVRQVKGRWDATG